MRQEIVVLTILIIEALSIGSIASADDHTLVTKLQTAQAELDSTVRPVTSAQVEASRRNLVDAAGRLDRFLARGTTANAQAWKRYLQWPQFQSVVGEAEPDPTVLGQLAVPYFSGAPGLELPAFIDVREALIGYRRLVMASDATLQEQVAEQLDAMGKILQSDDADSATHAAELAARLDWLEQMGQLPQVVHDFREAYGNPNLKLAINADTVAAALSDDVDEVSPVSEVILGTPVRGTARTLGQLSARLIPNAQQATLEIQLTGTTYSRTVGYQRPVTVHSQGTTSVFATKRLRLDSLIVVPQSASASCQASTQTCGIGTSAKIGRELVRKIAWKQVTRQKSAAEWEASRKAERRVREMVDGQASEMIAEVNRRLKMELRGPLAGRDLYPRRVDTQTTADHLLVRAVQAREQQLAAERDVDPVDSDIGMQVHESFVHNTAQSMIGGMQMTDEMMAKLAQEYLGEVPESLQLRSDEDPWSITFDRALPITVKFRDQQLTVALRGRQFARGDQVVRSTMQVSATYELQVVEGRARLVRLGSVDVTYPGKDGDRLSLAELSSKTFMESKFDTIFKPQIDGEGIEIPARLRRLGSLKMKRLHAQNGWLSVGWDRETGSAFTSAPSPSHGS